MSGWTWKAPEPRPEDASAPEPDRPKARLRVEDPEIRAVIEQILEFLEWDSIGAEDPRPAGAEFRQQGSRLVVRDAQGREAILPFPIDPGRLLDALDPTGSEPSGTPAVLDEDRRGPL
jgi:hypothetical protein